MRWFSKLGLLMALTLSVASAQTLGPPGGGGGSGGAPTGPAGGSLGGTYPNPIVTTNANLTGPITSTGNATAIASQTGTGTKFVVDTSPTIITPTFTTSATGPLLIGGTTAASTLTLQSTSGVGTTDFINAKVGNNGAVEAYRVLSNGNIGIGTTTPQNILVIGGSQSGNSGIEFALTGSSNMSSFNRVGSTYTQFQSDAASFVFRIAGSTSNGLYIAPSSGVSIGINNDPGAGGLQLNGQGLIPNATSDAGLTDATACLRTSNGQILKGSGTLGICLGTSGAQFKTAMVPMTAGLDQIAQLNLLNYRYRSGYGDSGERVQYGLTAQQVATVMPDLVRYNAVGDAVNFDIGALLPVALHAIQQLKADNDKLHSCQQNWKCRIFGIN